MKQEQAQIDWTDFLGRPPMKIDLALAESVVRDRSVLITGAGGSIGSGLAKAVLAGRPRALVMLELSEGALYESYRELCSLSRDGAVEAVPAIGDIADRKTLGHLFGQHRPELIFHAAAYKHVPLMEQNPFSAVANNAIGTLTLVGASLDAGVHQLIAVSTDKAVNPRSIMGASKRIAEQIVLSHGASDTRMNVVRLGNVLGSAGSVSPIFQEQAENGLTLTVTHADAERYFVTPAEAEAAILRAAAAPAWGRVLIPDCGDPFHVVDLARYIDDHCRPRNSQKSQIEFIGMRPGDKMREELVSEEEVVESELPDGIRVVVSPAPTPEGMEIAVQRLREAIGSFDHAGLMAAVCDLVPGYKPSSLRMCAPTMLEAG